MADPRIANLAQILVDYSLGVKNGERVGIVASTAAAPLVLELQRRILKAGGHPHTQVTLPGSTYIYFKEANNQQLDYISPTFRYYFEELDALIRLESETNSKELTTIDPERQARRGKAVAPLMRRYMDRTAAEEFRWVVSLFPTSSLAQDAEMSLSELEDFVYSTCHADLADPVDEWRAVQSRQEQQVEWLKGKREILVEGPHVELRMSIEGREFINSAGTFNMPDGEIYTSPVEDSMEGWIRFSYPAIHNGREVDGVELRIEGGRVTEASAVKNADFLNAMLEIDEGASVIGEFAIGTNKQIDRFTKNILFDEKLGGTIHIAVGAGFKEIGGTNESGLHWDMICDMRDGGKIFVDGELFYDSGEFMIGGSMD